MHEADIVQHLVPGEAVLRRDRHDLRRRRIQPVRHKAPLAMRVVGQFLDQPARRIGDIGERPQVVPVQVQGFFGTVALRLHDRYRLRPRPHIMMVDRQAPGDDLFLVQAADIGPRRHRAVIRYLLEPRPVRPVRERRAGAGIFTD